MIEGIDTGFDGTDRFQVLRLLGEGGMGVVYEAVDRETHARVALKTLRDVSGDGLLRLKNEFRALQDLQHPNLVSLGELHEEQGRWFFTMELIEGFDILEFVRPDAAVTSAVRAPRIHTSRRTEVDPAVPSGGDLDGERTVEPVPDAEPVPARYDEARLRSCLIQLAQGLVALHEAGKVHRDIKPSNILVTPAGRVVLLDFGLVTGVHPMEQSASLHLVGTMAYMSPEQAAAKPVGPETDWYSLGVVLYEALTGFVPFSGSALELMVKKQKVDPPPPRALVTDVSPELDALCMDLLRFYPPERADGPALLRRLGAELDGAPPLLPSRSSSSTSATFVGREQELQTLHDAFDATVRGEAVAVLVQGESGVGKSALVRRFLRQIEADDRGAVVLGGRCYEREVVPFKAIDGVVDELSQYMVRLPEVEAASLLPRAAALLGEVFPVLRRVKAVAQAPRVHADANVDPHELRRRLFAAVRELVARVADRRPLVLFIDDLQWADKDSLALIGEVLRPPDAPAVLAVATQRRRPAAQVGTGEWSAEIGRRGGPTTRRIRLGRLPVDDARELARLLAARASLPDAGEVDSIAAEAEGHPLFIQELVRHCEAHGGQRDGQLRLDDVLATRVAELPDDARGVLELVAVAGTPVPQRVVAAATGLAMPAFQRSLALLRVGNLVQTGGPRGGDAIHVYHDRVREALVARLDDRRRRDLHRELALALEASGSEDARVLAVHWRGAGDPQRAARYSERAAGQAAAAFAFDRAADLYRAAIELRPADHPSIHGLQLALADALHNAGRGGEAAETYLAAAAGASPADALELQRKAADQLLRSGRIDRGLDTIRAVLGALRMRLPATPLRSLISMLFRRALVRLRGLRYRVRDASAVMPQRLQRIDLCWSIGSSLGIVDNIRGGDFSARALLMALRAGEPQRLVRAFAVEAMYTSIRGGRSRARTEKLIQRTRSLADTLDRPEARFWALAAAGLSYHLGGRFRVATDELRRAEAVCRDECTGMRFEIDTVRLFLLFSLFYQGKTAELARRVPEHVAEAVDRGDLYGATNYILGIPNMAWLVTGELDEARRRAHRAAHAWSQRGFQVQHWYGLQAQGQLALYAGEAREGYDRLTERWGDLSRSLLFRVQVIQTETHTLRARCALAAVVAGQADAPDELVAVAERLARALLRERMPWVEAQSRLLLAGVAAARGRDDDAIGHLREAIRGAEGADMPLFASAGRWRLGELLGGTEGQELVSEARQRFEHAALREPDRWIELLAPGFRGA